MDCEFFFKEGERYLFFAIVAQKALATFSDHPQVCNWTAPVHSRRVVTPDGAVWLEDLIIREHGPGEPPGE